MTPAPGRADLMQPPLPLTPPVRCLRCDEDGTVYYLPGRPEVIGGQRRTCPECGGTKWVGGTNG
jgi:hypothetical protein